MADSSHSAGKADRRTVPVKLEMPEGTIEATMTLSGGSERLVALAFKMLSISSEVADMAARSALDAGLEISCRKGCGTCCRQLVPLSPPEAAMIYEFVETMPDPRRKRTRDRFAQLCVRLDELGFLGQLERLEDPHISDAEYHSITREYFNLDLACPFLEDESCSIYPVRPSMCREYLVTSPSENCRDPVNKPVNRLPVSIRLSEALARTWASLAGEAVKVVPLVLALRWTDRNREVRHVAGPSLAVFRTLLGHMSKTATGPRAPGGGRPDRTQRPPGKFRSPKGSPHA